MTREEAIEKIQIHLAYMGQYEAPKTKESLGVAITALREQPQWISVEERLPETWKSEDGDLANYVVFMPEYGVDIGNYVKSIDKWVCMGLPVNVTHWMPLPKAPKVEV